jgi:ectoine hydroxylase-related dioxygenase (phytanoyl-CoA dioxygenase family)
MHFGAGELDALTLQYENDGFVKIQPLFNQQRIQEIEHELADYTQKIVPTLLAGDVIWESERLADGSRAIRNLFRIDRHCRYFEELAQSYELLSLIARLVHGEPVLCGVETFSKPAYVGSIVPYHQDNAYFNLTPPDSLTCWIALDDSSPENGCVYYARGSHRGGLRAHKASAVKGNSMTLAEPPARGEFEEIPGVLHRGGAILHHCVLIHRSEPNRSPRARRGLVFVYRGSHCQKNPEGEAAYRAVLAAARD